MSHILQKSILIVYIQHHKLMQIFKNLASKGVLYSLLFNMCSEAIFHEASEDVTMGVKVNVVWINNIRYADDRVFIPDNITTFSNWSSKGRKSVGLDINTKINKMYDYLQKPEHNWYMTITFNARLIEGVNRYK